MTTDAQIQGLIDGRASLRELAKWLISGVAGAAALIVGASTFSQLGTLSPSGDRFWIAVLALAFAAWLCWRLFTLAVDVLRSELLSLQLFAQAKDGDLKAAADRVSALMAGQFGESEPGRAMPLRSFVEDFADIRAAAWAGQPEEVEARAAIDHLDRVFDVCRQACVSALVSVRFERLVDTLRWPGCLILVALLVFAWAANPPKEAAKAPDKPAAVILTLAPETIRQLKAAAAPTPSGPATPGADPGAVSVTLTPETIRQLRAAGSSGPVGGGPADPHPEPRAEASGAEAGGASLLLGWLCLFLGLAVYLVSRMRARTLRGG